MQRFSGTSGKGDFHEALNLAIADAMSGLGTDLVKWTLLLVSGVNGGFRGQNDLTVEIEAAVFS
jgi:hypothetical protein